MTARYNILNDDDLKSIIDDLSIKNNPVPRSFVVYTGQTGMFLFDIAMQGLRLPNGVSYTHTTFKKVYKYLYLNIGKKHEPTKIKIDKASKIYIPLLGTVELGRYKTIEEAVNKLRPYINGKIKNN